LNSNLVNIDGVDVRFMAGDSPAWKEIDGKVLTEMASEARDFVESQKRLLQVIEDHDGFREHFPTAAIVLGALAAEIALKALVARDNNITKQRKLREFVRGPEDGPDMSHNLEFLFSKTSPGSQQVIRREWSLQLEGADLVYYLTRGSFQNATEFKTMTFEFLLRDHSASFVKWRYVYEPKELQAAPLFVGALALAAIEALNTPPA
jgi:hypothetical protein